MIYQYMQPTDYALILGKQSLVAKSAGHINLSHSAEAVMSAMLAAMKRTNMSLTNGILRLQVAGCRCECVTAKQEGPVPSHYAHRFPFHLSF